ncbi:MAG TPA: penicillin-binding protein activator [Stellaceae bacterium]|jgi:ABC-type branched-subunit amino acid transport system substrate-binding protein|nr:penicillin-binding protein activator [Stellaceae bacterium]
MVAAPVGPPQSPFGGANPAVPPPGPPGPQAGSGVVKVALLVPLSGPNAELGKSMLEAAQLALFTVGGDRLTLVPRDTAGGAANAARSAIAEGAQLILGPLLAAEVESVKPIVRDARINMIAFSTATQLAGGNAFLMGFLPRQEVVREVAVAHDKGMNRFAALAPNSQYGHLMTDALRDAANAAGGSVDKIEYLDQRGDAGAAIQRLLGSAAPSSSAAAGAATAPPPVPSANASFDALLLPEGGAQLKQIAQQLTTAGLDTKRVRLLGSGLWDDSSIAGEPALYGGWFAASPPDQRREFDSRFQSTYGHPAPRLASLAFDAAALAGVLAKNGGPDPFSQDAILNPAGFTGVDGLFRFTRDGLVQRGLAVLEVGPGGNSVISPAPQNFANIGF